MYSTVYDLQPCRRPCSSRLWHRHQPVSARMAGGRPVPAGGCIGLFCHLVCFPALFDGHGHLFLHAAFLRRRPDAGPDQRIDLRAGCDLQLLPHQPHPADTALRPERHSLGCRPRSPGCGAWHSAFHDHRRSAGAGRPAAAGRPPLHPEARLLEDHPRLSAQPLAGGCPAGRRARSPRSRWKGRCPALRPERPARHPRR